MNKILLSFLLLFTFLNAKENVVSKNVEPAPLEQEKEIKVYVQVSDIPHKAASTTSEIKNIRQTMQDVDAKNKDMHLEIEPYCDSVGDLLNTSLYTNISEHNVRELQKMKSELAVYSKQLEEWEKVLESQIDIYDKKRLTLKEYSIIWNETQMNAGKEEVPEVIIENIHSVIKSIEELEDNIKNKYDETLTLSQVLTNQMVAINEMNLILKDSETLANKNIFFRNQESLLSLLSQNSFAISSYVKSIKSTVMEKYIELLGYFQAHHNLNIKFYIFIFLSSGFIFYSNYLYRKRKLFINEDSYEKKEYFFIKNIFSTLIIITMLCVVAIFPERPSTLRELILLTIIIPVIRILQTVVNKEHYKYLYGFFLIYIFYSLNNNALGFDLESRLVLLGLNISLIVYFISLIRTKRLDSIGSQYISKSLKYAVSLSVLFLFIAIVSNLYGSVLLTYKIIHTVLFIFYAFALFYVVYILLIAYVTVLLRRRISTASFMLAKYSQKIENTINYFIKVWILLWLALVISKILGLQTLFLSLGNDFLALSWNISGTVISIQSIVDFIVIVIATWFIAKVIKIILEVEVFARFKLPRGAPTAILTILNYFIVITGTIVAFTSLGMTSQQFAIVFGALGVGIGFGLRNIIANFVSGIILVFERPVQIGDVIEIDKTMGSVQSIGARASTLQTFDGSEVIIPNADFIGKEIINWTLSDERRRKTVEFKVNLENDIDKILEIMKDVVSAHPDVLKDPEPLATFKGFGEYTLDFKIYFWLSDNLIVAQSDIAIGIYKALRKEGVKMPVQKTHLQGDRL